MVGISASLMIGSLVWDSTIIKNINVIMYRIVNNDVRICNAVSYLSMIKNNKEQEN